MYAEINCVKFEWTIVNDIEEFGNCIFFRAKVGYDCVNIVIATEMVLFVCKWRYSTVIVRKQSERLQFSKMKHQAW